MKDIAGLIDHSLLRADASPEDIGRLCREAVRFGFHSVCVNPCHVERAAAALASSQVRVATVIGFPLGATFTGAKVYEAMGAALMGAHEIDMVMNIGAAKAGDWGLVERDISDVLAATTGLVRKVIIEACYLRDDEKRRAVEAALRAGADFIKTSTGFGPGGATVHDVRLIREAVGGRAGIKAAGGIKTLGQALEMVEAGATRIGTSSGPSIVEEARGRR
ncbi:MAG: deoxyribose-phosphate aldolase [Thermodesulfovibrionales bacterium]